METVIKLTEINKIYRTDEVETQALENVNAPKTTNDFNDKLKAVPNWHG